MTGCFDCAINAGFRNTFSPRSFDRRGADIREER